jgi:hypothetical protein
MTAVRKSGDRKRAKVKPMIGVPLEPHVSRVLDDTLDVDPFADLVTLAVAAWGAEHQHTAEGAAGSLEYRFHRAFNKPLEAVSPERYDRKNPRECAGGTCDGLDFAFRGEKLSIVVPCAQKDCPQELAGPVDGIVELGRVLSLIEDEKADGETEWRCHEHRKGAVV